MQTEALATLRERVVALRAPSCGMAHESILATPDGAPVQSARSPSGYARPGICPEATRAVHLGCSHTMARYVLREALAQLPGSGSLSAELHDLEQEISLLDHRRYDAEVRRADAALRSGDVVKNEKNNAPVDRIMSVGPGEVAFYETRCKIVSAKPLRIANPNDKNQVNAEAVLMCKGEGVLWEAREIWHLQTIDGNKVAVVTALSQTNYRDERGRKRATPSLITTSIY